jgi:hypothetical protein
VRLIGELKDWTALDQYLVRYLSDPEERVTTAIASSFAASLEMVREGSARDPPGRRLSTYLSCAGRLRAESSVQGANHDDGSRSYEQRSPMIMKPNKDGQQLARQET